MHLWEDELLQHSLFMRQTGNDTNADNDDDG